MNAQLDRLDPTIRWAQETNVSLPRHVFEDTIRGVDKITALKIIRAAYRDPDGAYCSLQDAQIIYGAIVNS